MGKTKIFAAYLPQYHEIKENNKFWGKGYTDWVAVKKCKPIIDGQIQPRIPLNYEYYDLSDWKAMKNQAELAKKYGLDGFGIYHYWFKDGHKVLEKPAENLLNHPEIDIEYYFVWDNGSWVRSWSNISGNDWAPLFENDEKLKTSSCLLECDYQDEEAWREHFDYLFPFFTDPRYFRINNKPVFIFFSSNDSEKLKRMIEKWNLWAIEKGLEGIYFIVRKSAFIDKHICNYRFVYQPIATWAKKRAITNKIYDFFKIKKEKRLEIYDYAKEWDRYLKIVKRDILKNEYFSCLVQYDDTPRRGNKGNIFKGATPELFQKYFSKFYEINCIANKEFCTLTAWNEWGEGAYLEPDENIKYGYLEAVKSVVDKYDKK